MKAVRFISLFIFLTALSSGCSHIDRKAVISRNFPHITYLDTLASLSVGNGEFAFTADVTGLQTWPELYSSGVPLGTQTQWGWHSFPNPEGFEFEECLESKDFGRGVQELYACQFSSGRKKQAADYFRANPHRLHLGTVGFLNLEPSDVSYIDQTLDLWEGVIRSSFSVDGIRTSVLTCADPELDAVSVSIESASRLSVVLRFPYPTGVHTDDACDWDSDEMHCTEVVFDEPGLVVLRRSLDGTVYYVTVRTDSSVHTAMTGRNEFVMTPVSDSWSFSVRYSSVDDRISVSAEESRLRSTCFWKSYWEDGGIVDFSHCTDPRASELERRVVLSQYLTAIQCAGSTPPQETGLTYNSWFGKFHLEMIWWHQAHFALWGHPELIERTLPWYREALPVAREIAKRQGFEGCRWMKMTDPSGMEAPSNVGSFLIWQQPHLIYLAELLRRSGRDVSGYADLVGETAAFMADFTEYDESADRYVLRGCIPAQETLNASETFNPPFELSYWKFALETADRWQELYGNSDGGNFSGLASRLSSLASMDGLYLAAESEPGTYSDIRLYSDHMAVLAACGVLPVSDLLDAGIMRNTLHWVMNNWNWDKTWGWDYPVTCMNAVRLGEPETAVDAIMMNNRTNTYLPDGHNYQDSRLRCYLPGNGGLLAAVALMCAGYDGCTEKNPGFPKDGTWDVRWEGLEPMP